LLASFSKLESAIESEKKKGESLGKLVIASVTSKTALALATASLASTSTASLATALTGAAATALTAAIAAASAAAATMLNDSEEAQSSSHLLQLEHFLHCPVEVPVPGPRIKSHCP